MIANSLKVQYAELLRYLIKNRYRHSTFPQMFLSHSSECDETWYCWQFREHYFYNAAKLSSLLYSCQSAILNLTGNMFKPRPFTSVVYTDEFHFLIHLII